jgi:hypothetical protein
MKLHEGFSPEESDKIYANFLAIVNDSKRRDKLVRKHGANAENVAYGTAVNQVKNQSTTEPSTEETPTEETPVEEPTTEEPMDQEQKLKEMIQAALSKPLSEKKKSSFTPKYDDKFTDKRKNLPDGLQKSILKKQGNLEEDLDLGHEDNEPHMIKGDLYEIGTYAMELYKMVDQFEGEQEVDFPGWWQSKITTAKNMISSAKHYLEFELNEPKIDNMLQNVNEGDTVTADQVKALKDKFEKYVENLAKAIEFLKKGESPQAAEIYKAAKAKLGENTLEEKMSKPQIKKRGEIYDTLKDKGMSDEKAGKIATSQAMKKKIKEAVLAKMKQK